MPRSIRSRMRRKMDPVSDLDMTSLLDIITILLVFLILSYNPNNIVFKIPGSVDPPTSETNDLNTEGVVVIVSATHIWVDGEPVLDPNSNTNRAYDHGGRRILPLFNELVRRREIIQRTEKTAPNAKKFSGQVNLIMDKSLKYSFLKKILYTTAEAGYGKYRMVVKNNRM